MIETVLCVDIGTTSLKAAFITAEGEVVSFSKYIFLNSEDRMIGHFWLSALKSCILKMFRSQTDLKQMIQVRAVSISGNGPTLVSKSGLTLRWNEEYKVDRSKTGPSLFLPKVLAFRELFPRDFEKSDFIFSGPEYLIYELTGQAVTVLPEERYIPAYWDEKILKLLNIDAKKMPPFAGIGQKLGCLKSDVQVFLDLGEGEIPVYSCGPDFVAALVGTNTLSAGKLCDRSGSSEGFNFCIEKPVSQDGLRLLPSVIPGLWNISALIVTSSKLSEKKRLEKVKDGVEKLRAFSKKNDIIFPSVMTVTGGQTKNKKWMNLKAQAVEMNLAVCKCSDSELLGDACAAWFGLGKYGSLQEASQNIVKEDLVYEGL